MLLAHGLELRRAFYSRYRAGINWSWEVIRDEDSGIALSWKSDSQTSHEHTL